MFVASSKLSPCLPQGKGHFLDVDEFAMSIEVLKIILCNSLRAGTDLNGIFKEIINAFLKELMISVLSEVLLQ